ncbi:hypothetical protein J5U18_13685 [Sphingobacteriaceae bacterium WQ 2009]|uniref:Uncharacterized protein n=1 Tax=Rhinopithecimicrobium faecis TaxID=2820698 RepID=A0A8T4HCR6_9SPHI|nr:hypothetical protein [Sphingobacteriaceae bacterium WQ 2009]
MNCICNFLYDILPTKPDKIQAWASIITTSIAGYALFSWKSTSRHTYTFELIENLDESKEAILVLRNFVSKELSEKTKQSIRIGASNYDAAVNKESIENKLDKYATTIKNIKRLALKSGILKKNNPLRFYYWELREFILMFENDYKVYINILENIEYYHKELASLRKAGDSNLEEFRNNQLELQENRSLEEKYRNILFMSGGQKDEFSVKFFKLFNQANKFAKEYNL